MDLPGPSTPTSQQAMDFEMNAEQVSSTSRKRSYPEDSGDDSMTVETSNDSDNDAEEVATDSTEPPVTPINFGKKKKLSCGYAHQGCDFYESSLSSSSVSVSSRSEEMYVEPRQFLPTPDNYPNIYKPAAESGPATYNNDDHILYGYWLIFSNVQGGWNYSVVKNYLQRELKLDTVKGKSSPTFEPGPEAFRIIVSFYSKEERDVILNTLLLKNVGAYFRYIAVDSLPIGSYDYDTDSDEEEWDDYGLLNY